MKLCTLILLSACLGCSETKQLSKLINQESKVMYHARDSINLDSLATSLNALSSREREKIIVPIMLAGNIPAFNVDFKKIRINYRDSSGKKHKAILFVSPDYLSIGDNDHFIAYAINATIGAANCRQPALHFTHEENG